MMLLAATAAQAQINIQGKVFGGARQADVQGHTFVHIGADKHDVVIDYVYGGNDISGTIGSSGDPESSDKIPSALSKAVANGVNNSWNAFVKLSAGAKKIYIGQLFGGGYGDYKYENEKFIGGKKKYDVDIDYWVWNPDQNDYGPGTHEIKEIDKPELGKTYLEITGGSIVYAYGGGNNVTVTNSAVISVDNPTAVVNSITAKNPDGTDSDIELLTPERFLDMGINTLFSHPSSDEFQIGRLFGGNNKAEMAIRPMWNLQQGKIRDLYSGGNEGAMTSPVGLLLEINPKVAANLSFEEAKVIKDKLIIDNVYGGCRKADVHPKLETGEDPHTLDIQLPDKDENGQDKYKFPAGLSARVLVYGGDVNNVYGGNDVAGHVYGGNAVGVYSSIRGSIYGGGNGSYPYTDNVNLKDSRLYGDFYYDVISLLNKEQGSSFTGLESAQALNLFRPNAEQVSVRVKGADALHPTIIGGSIYVGGNSATLNTTRTDAIAQLKIGSYVIAENVFLGNNGENMIKYENDDDVLKLYANYIKKIDNAHIDKQTSAAAGYTKFNSMDLTDMDVFAKFMDGCAMSIRPDVVFDTTPTDPDDYEEYSTYFGSFYCGGNVGSITKSGKLKIDFTQPVVVYDKVVGGCNNAYVLPTPYNAAYQGGIIGSVEERPTSLAGESQYTDTGGNIKERLELNFNGLKIQPMRMPIEGVDKNGDEYVAGVSLSTNDRYLPMVWNTIKLGVRDDDGKPVPVAWSDNTWSSADSEGHTAEYNSTVNRRFTGGNIYGGCCESGVVNGNVVININASIVDRSGEHAVFDVVPTDDKTGEDKLYDDDYDFSGHEVVSGVILGQQGMDVLGSALNVFGGGKGVETEIWGSTTINLKRGYVFQIFGGSEQGAIGKRNTETTDGVTTYPKQDGKYIYEYNDKYSTYVNLTGSASNSGKPKSQDLSEDIAEAEFLYGGGFEGAIAGNTHINLDNGRIFNSFAGSCNADIQGHTETIIGANGFPYVRDYVYGGNDLGGRILGSGNFESRVRTQERDDYDAISKVYNRDMLNASAYTEFIQGRVEKIFGGCYGVYDYTDPLYGEYFYAKDADDTTTDNLGTHRPGYSKPFLGNAFINFRPTESNNPLNTVEQIYGAGQGYFTEKEENLMQNSSYILIDVPKDMTVFQGTEVFGGGECGGVGMGVDQAIANAPETADRASAIIDLARGHFKAVYGGSYQEGITRRTVVNVPEGSIFRCNNIFGGAYGRIDVETRNKQENGVDVLDDEGHPVEEVIETPRIDVACDVYEAIVNYNSADAIVDYAVYGGNNACRRTLYSQVNINAPVKGGTHWTGVVNVYGAGYGVNTWSQYTEVNLNDGARVQEVYGGGENGQVLNLESVTQWQTDLGKDANDKDKLFLGLEGYTDYGFGSNEHPTPTNSNRLYAVDNTRPQYYNTNVHINRGATVARYCYGGGLGHGNIAHSGNVYGTTYIDLLGGTVDYDLYAAGTTGSVKDSLAVGNATNKFIASSTAYIEGGKVRNVYGGGWAGTVGHHNGDITASHTGDIYGETHVVIGIDKDHLPASDGTNDFHYYHGIPTVTRNAYGGGEGGAVWGTAHLTMQNGYVGYQYDTSKSDDAETPDFDERYVEKIEDDTFRDNDGHFLSNKRLNDAGCIFGGGYIDNSSVDVTDVKMYGGHVRNAMFGGGEIAAIGRGAIAVDPSDETKRRLEGIYKAGSTSVELFDGYVHRNVFGGGRGYNNLGEGGSLFSDGFVFGHTQVHIHGGEVGTPEEVLNENGNVFGGGDIGYVYGAIENDDGTMYVGIKDGERYNGGYEGYYYAYNMGNDPYITADYVYDENDPKWVTDVGEYILTEDCKVLVEPQCKVLTACTINGHNYGVGDYVPIEDLNALGNKNVAASSWANLDLKGIIIHNAVFAGGNTTKGATNANAFANTTSVFGNATASIHDVYNRDLITLGSGRIGGLYGDGNLTLVDGYRGLNITNYGTDYYTISSNMQISLDDYEDDTKYNDRERAYYQLTYICKQACTDDEGTTYFPQDADHSQASKLTADEILTLFQGNGTIGTPGIVTNGVINPEYWELYGVCTIYAGRPMNTIQRADFCGVFGSRMVMQGAQDRVPEVVDYKRYTINRVREVSLNKKHYKVGGVERENDYHGNYFGIYSHVNYLGALTSDLDFNEAVRVTDNIDEGTYKKAVTIDGTDYGYGEATYEQWKQANRANRTRNNGNSHNKVALASGVYLELTSEKSTGDDLYEKDWGPITGVVELDLINVQPGIGGGFVYAKNIHGKRTHTPKEHATLTALNHGAVTSADFTYTEPTTPDEWESSGNFVHGEQVIIDDCYNVSAKYLGADAVPAHYWYIQGSVYVYDQYISVYAGVPNAYSETVDIPLTITAASHGTMKLLNVQPNLYAYYNSNGTKLGENQKLNINGVNYQLNDSISYWDWYKLTKAEQNLFVKETYVVVDDCWIGEQEYKKGYVLLKDEYDRLSTETVIQKKENEQGVVEDETVEFSKMFRPTNNVSHDTGYILTYKMNNPTDWSTWYTTQLGDWNNKNQTGGNGYEDGPTYSLQSGVGEVLGQREYSIGDLVPEEVYTTYEGTGGVKSHLSSTEGQATFEKAYIVTSKIDIPGTTSHYYPGATLSATDAAAYPGKVEEAYICTKTIQLSTTEFIYVNSKMTEEEKNAYATSVNNRISAIAGSAINSMGDLTEEQQAALSYEQKKELRTLLQTRIDINNLITKAYYCTWAGLYGGDYYESGRNYRGISAWSGMSPTDRLKFKFNYDAFDLLIDPYYSMDKNNPTATLHQEGMKYQYDSSDGNLTGAQANPAGYSLERPVNYTATYNLADELLYTPDEGGNQVNAADPAHNELSRTEFERLPNEQRHYSPINVTNTSIPYYVVKMPVTIGTKPYAVGASITAEEFGKLSDADKNERISQLHFTESGTYYFCREEYKIGENGAGSAVTSATGVTGATGGSYADDTTVPVGVVISNTDYRSLPNKQLGFTIHGIAPTEVSTLYVSRNSDIDDLSRGKIITVIYQYDYEESDESGQHITPITERHIVNIHIYFKSGSPTVEDIDEPPLILPGNLLGMREPNVIPGATEVTGGGWKLFENESDAESHKNGIEYTPNVDPLFWYQDGYWLEYYAKSYIGGETYSNKVKIKVANYHDLTDVMNDEEHHYYVDIPDIQRLERVPKIYINDETNGIQQLKDLFDLSIMTEAPTTGSLAGHALLNPQVKSCDNLEFFMRTNVTMPSGSTTWTPIANGEGECFEGKLHGDGHYIDGLTNSLFGHLCGDVYNLGVMGSFSSAGIADTGKGFIENCWMRTTGTPDGSVKAIFGTPTADSGTKQIVNCYYPEAPEGATIYYSTTDDGNHGLARPMPIRAFHNGTVAYNLNGFYLFKRYWDKQGGNTGTDYKYYIPGIVDQATGSLVPQTEYYGQDVTYCSSGYNGEKYVEDRFADGDFRYAGGTIPENVDERLYIDAADNNKSKYYPIWPDDYLFFGQMLTYGWNEARPHEEVPSPIVKTSGRLPDPELPNSDINNRVYRAPAYYRSSTMDVAHFNPDVNLVAYSKPKNAADNDVHPAYPNMTAIDFAGHNDTEYKLGLNDNWFYQPLLDDDGLRSIVNTNETPNLLVYAPSVDANSATYTVLTDYFKEPAYSTYYKGGGYRCVEAAPTQTIFGHLVQNDLTATNDHLLVDKQDFYCPISYRFIHDSSEDTNDGTRMWYQRVPENYVESVWYGSKRSSKGWEAISLPFAAELVTTVKKGEITHFYSGSEDSKNNTNTKLGHEYWLREYRDISAMTESQLALPDDATDEEKAAALKEAKAEALFTYPIATDTWEVTMDKTTKNSFLWDYYYMNSNALDGNEHKDANLDTYQTYYKPDDAGIVNEFEDYACLSNAVPYIIGFPGKTFYEFDLSGNFEAETTADDNPDLLPEQTITFASAAGYQVLKSDEEEAGMVTNMTHEGYTFRPSYLNNPELQTGQHAFLLSADGSRYMEDVTNTAVAKVTAFRSYFTGPAASGSGGARPVTRSIVFSNDDSEMKGVIEHGDPTKEEAAGTLNIYAKKHKIIVESALGYTTDVRIVNLAGMTINAFTIEPGETVETRINTSGVYIVEPSEARFIKKLSVK